jgi:hypothetical protein
VRAHVPLVWKLASDAQLAVGYERYDYRNVIDFLTDDGGVGTLSPVRRRDLVLDGRIALVRPVTRAAQIELAWRRLERISNVDIYSYDRDILGVYVNLHTY